MSDKSDGLAPANGRWMALLALVMVTVYCCVCLMLFRSLPEPCTYSRDISCQNLNAAQALNIVTLLGIFVSGIGTVALVVTVYYSHKATNAATDAVKIANESAQHSKDMSYRELRPYIFVVNRLSIRELDTEHENIVKGRRFEITWKNEGKTPAINVSSQANYLLSDGPLPDRFHFPNRYTPTRIGTLGPGGMFNSSTQRLNLSDVKCVIDKTKYLYVYGWVEYEEFSLKRRHRSEYCAKVEFLNAMEADSDLLATTYYIESQFNDMDENCYSFENESVI